MLARITNSKICIYRHYKENVPRIEAARIMKMDAIASEVTSPPDGEHDPSPSSSDILQLLLQ